MVKHNISKFFCLLLFIPFLSACWDQIAIDERAYVVALGLGKSEDENKIQVTFLITNPELSKKEAGTNEPALETISFQANDVIVAKNKANSVIAKEVSYNLLRAVIISEEFAKEDRTLRWMYDLSKEYEIKRNVPLIVVKESIDTFFQNNRPQLETKIHKYFDLILESANKSGLIPKSNLNSYYRVTEADGDLYLVIYGTSEISQGGDGTEDEFIAGKMDIQGETNQVQFIGSAIFKEGKMIGKLNGEETRLAILLNNTLKMGVIYTTYTDPFNEKYKITSRILNKENIHVKMDLKNNSPSVDVSIPIYMDIMTQHSMVDYVNDSEKRGILKKSIEKEITDKITALVKRTQEEFKGEPFGWSIIARKQFATLPEYREFDWMNTYPSMEVNIKVEVNFGNFGQQSEIPNFEEVRD
ncbi:hypothetical protein CD30_19180 [Ureibacillus massiliensis 4400831 = CIP 108448 = CCUG 49529]|uniref:Uncharacterized protein n=1 Tax=Ureibacillus massiliensis 4400831 = CIP 108448 = CCUG 49529 TaxID=1211035 RepID=A0A0A3IKM9_9BACL|nr:Ger(x)C family spore germination protein [Ureibacillus massiliensis]KGR85296.1 hypothetical protein CD30_19180 [Ureibacillus massiliensis 4400831 = CIP 108448 = CCUG 49529]